MSPEAQRLVALVGELTGLADPEDLKRIRELAEILETLARRKRNPIDKQTETSRGGDRSPRVVVEVDGQPVDVKVGSDAKHR